MCAVDWRRRRDLATLTAATALAVVTGRPPATPQLRQLHKQVNVAWRDLGRRPPPTSVHDHLELTPALRVALGTRVLKTVDVLPPGALCPCPRADTQGRPLHSLLTREALLTDLFAGRLSAAVFEDASLALIRNATGRVYALTPGTVVGARLRVRSKQAAAEVLLKSLPPRVTPCTVVVGRA